MKIFALGYISRQNSGATCYFFSLGVHRGDYSAIVVPQFADTGARLAPLSELSAHRDRTKAESISWLTRSLPVPDIAEKQREIQISLQWAHDDVQGYKLDGPGGLTILVSQSRAVVQPGIEFCVFRKALADADISYCCSHPKIATLLQTEAKASKGRPLSRTEFPNLAGEERARTAFREWWESNAGGNIVLLFRTDNEALRLEEIMVPDLFLRHVLNNLR